VAETDVVVHGTQGRVRTQDPRTHAFAFHGFVE
jgi:hypothetical protein